MLQLTYMCVCTNIYTTTTNVATVKLYVNE